MPRIRVEAHAARIVSIVEPVLLALGEERVALDDAAGRLLARDVRSALALPPFRNSQMDGYAARAADLAAAPVTLPVAGTVPAGRGEPRVLPAGALLKVMTGAPLPEGADCVVPVEDTAASGAGDGVEVRVAHPVGRYVREAGSDLPAGGLVVAAETLLAPRHLAALAAAGVAEVPVRRRARIAVLTTGAEVVAPGGPLGPGEVHDANRIALSALAREAGAEVVLAELVDDRPAAFAETLDRALAVADLVLTSGGISQGDFEVVRQVLEPRGAEVTELAMQPGGPQATAVLGGVPVLAFPGNPVSSQVSFTVFLRPLLRRAAGLPAIEPLRLPLGAPLRSVPEKRQWSRGVIENGRVRVVGGPGSHLVTAMAHSDVLVDVPVEVLELPEGADVTVLPL